VQRDRQELRHRGARRRVSGDARPAAETTQLVPLSLLVLGDEATRAEVAGAPAITIDGCKLACAMKMVAQSGGTVAQELSVLDVFRRHRDLKPAGIAELNEGGQRLAGALADEVAALVDALALVAARSPMGKRKPQEVIMPDLPRRKSASWPAPARRWPRAR